MEISFDLNFNRKQRKFYNALGPPFGIPISEVQAQGFLQHNTLLITHFQVVQL